MQSDFDKALHFVLNAEGGLSDDKGDPGGRTNHGITHAEYDAYRTAHGQSVQDVAKISDAEVSAIYKTQYWDRIRGDYVAWPLCLVLFDSCVNCGVGTAIGWLNAGLGLSGHAWSGETSGKYHALTSDDLRDLACKVLVFRHGYYVAIAARRPVLQKFVAGWLRRIAAVKTAAGLV